MTFHVGQKVVCILDGFPRYFGDEVIPVKGNIYAVRAVHAHDDRIGLLLHGIDNRHLTEKWGCGREPGFNSMCFRPITDISFAHEILRKVIRKHKERA